MTLRLPADPDSDVMSTASSGEIDGNSDYVESPKNFPTRLFKMTELEGHILELQQIHEVAEDYIDENTQPTEIFAQNDDLDPT